MRKKIIPMLKEAIFCMIVGAIFGLPLVFWHPAEAGEVVTFKKPGFTYVWDRYSRMALPAKVVAIKRKSPPALYWVVGK